MAVPITILTATGRLAASAAICLAFALPWAAYERDQLMNSASNDDDIPRPSRGHLPPVPDLPGPGACDAPRGARLGLQAGRLDRVVALLAIARLRQALAARFSARDEADDLAHSDP